MKNIIATMTATSSGNSSGSGSGSGSGTGSTTQTKQLHNSGGGSEGDIMQVRKRKRMQSNRESARRSRMRKQKHLDDLMTQVTTLRKENSEIMTSINMTNQLFSNVDSENSILRVRIMELSHRLQSLDEILNGVSVLETNHNHNHNYNHNHDHDYDLQNLNLDSFVNPWNLLYVNQPIIAASADVFQYY